MLQGRPSPEVCVFGALKTLCEVKGIEETLKAAEGGVVPGLAEKLNKSSKDIAMGVMVRLTERLVVGVTVQDPVRAAILEASTQLARYEQWEITDPPGATAAEKQALAVKRHHEVTWAWLCAPYGMVVLHPAIAKMGVGRGLAHDFTKGDFEGLVGGGHMSLRVWAVAIARFQLLKTSPSHAYAFYLFNVFGYNTEYSKVSAAPSLSLSLARPLAHTDASLVDRRTTTRGPSADKASWRAPTRGCTMTFASEVLPGYSRRYLQLYLWRSL